MRHWRMALALIAVVSFGIALSYPIQYYIAQRRNNSELEQLSALRARTLQAQSTEAMPSSTATPAEATLSPSPVITVWAMSSPSPTTPVSAMPSPSPVITAGMLPPSPVPTDATPAPTPSPTPTIAPTPTPDRSVRVYALPYPSKEKVVLDEALILEELRPIYQLNRDLVGWITIPETVIDYPVVQCANSDYYLDHDFYGNRNVNGQIILDSNCDPYTPSYNLVVSGHKMRNGSMFGGLTEYASARYWREHPCVEFDTLMARKRYIVFAAFLSANYDEDEKGFRYNVDLQYRIEVERWLDEIRENQLYDTGVDARYGDEFLTLTTCSRNHHRDGRFVVVCRRLREGED